MKYLIRLLFIPLLLLCYSYSYGQDLKSDKIIEYEGKVLNKKTKGVLEGVVILFTDPKTGEMSGTVTSEKGEFRIKIPRGVPYLTFDMPGIGKKKLILSEVDSIQYLKLEILLGEGNK